MDNADPDDSRVPFSRRQLLGSSATIGGASALGGAASLAYLSDEEAVANNRLVAGELELAVSWTTYYSDPSTSLTDQPDGVVVRPQAVQGIHPTGSSDGATSEAVADGSGTPCAADLKAPAYRPIVDLDDVKPGDFGGLTFVYSLCDNPGFVWLDGGLVDAAERGFSAAEWTDPDERPGLVELVDALQVTVWVDADGPDRSAYFQGTLREAIGAFRSARGLVLDPARASERIECHSPTPATYSVGLQWHLPVDHANEIQTDTVRFSLGLYAEQCRHNDVTAIGFGQQGYGNAGYGGVVL